MVTNISILGKFIPSSWQGTQAITLWLQLASAPFLCLLRESGPRLEGNRSAFSALVVMGSIGGTGVVWALGWISLTALAAFLFPPALHALVSSFEGNSPSISLLAGVIGTAITAPAIKSQSVPCLLSWLASFLLISRLCQVAGAFVQHVFVILLFSALSTAAIWMCNVLNATLLTHFGAAADLGGLFGIGDATANLWGIVTPALAAGLSDIGHGAWAFVALSFLVSASLIP